MAADGQAASHGASSTGPPKAVLRGLYDPEEGEDVDPLVDNSIFTDAPWGHMRFQTAAECKAYMEAHVTTHSNPDFPTLTHIFTMLVTWEQVRQHLIEKMDKFNMKYPLRRMPLSAKEMENNIYLQKSASDGLQMAGLQSWLVREGVQRRLDLPFHRSITRQSTINTLRYEFDHMRAGIFVMIRDNRLVLFAPFVNKDFTNNWGPGRPAYDSVRFETLKDYYLAKELSGCRRENVLPETKEWWANGNIICNEHVKPGQAHSQYWGDQFLCPVRDLLQEACEARAMPDCDFFVNKRDYPHLKFNEESQEPVEPYGFIYDKDDRLPEEDVPLTRCKYPTYTPIASFYCSARFADIPFPTSEDWEAATGLVYPKTFKYERKRPQKGAASAKEKEKEKGTEAPPKQAGEQGAEAESLVEVEAPRELFTEANFRQFERPWEEKTNTAFFRGTATGGGVTPDTNQRLKLAQLSHDWKNHSEYGGDSKTGRPPFLDAAITGWNRRDKKLGKIPMMFIEPNNLPFTGGKENFTPIYKQSTYKYLIYAEGHCAACRYGFMMRLGSVIIKVDSSCVADLMWYFPLLRPWVDHVPVQADCSDLAEKVQWCRDNDDKCREIADNARRLYDRFVGRQAALDYVQMVAYEINQRMFIPPEAWEEPPPEALAAPRLPPPVRDYCYSRGATRKACARCRREAEKELLASQAKKDAESQMAAGVKQKEVNLRARMKRLALKGPATAAAATVKAPQPSPPSQQEQQQQQQQQADEATIDAAQVSGSMAPAPATAASSAVRPGTTTAAASAAELTDARKPPRKRRATTRGAAAATTAAAAGTGQASQSSQPAAAAAKPRLPIRLKVTHSGGASSAPFRVASAVGASAARGGESLAAANAPASAAAARDDWAGYATTETNAAAAPSAAESGSLGRKRRRSASEDRAAEPADESEEERDGGAGGGGSGGGGDGDSSSSDDDLGMLEFRGARQSSGGDIFADRAYGSHTVDAAAAAEAAQASGRASGSSEEEEQGGSSEAGSSSDASNNNGDGSEADMGDDDDGYGAFN